jgi:hypothetical protein
MSHFIFSFISVGFHLHSQFSFRTIFHPQFLLSVCSCISRLFCCCSSLGDSMVLFNRIVISVNFGSTASTFTVRLTVPDVPKYFSDYASVKSVVTWPSNVGSCPRLLHRDSYRIKTMLLHISAHSLPSSTTPQTVQAPQTCDRLPVQSSSYQSHPLDPLEL